MPYHFDDSYDFEADIQHILIERTKISKSILGCPNRFWKTIKYSIILNKTYDYGLDYISKVYTRFIKTYLDRGFEGTFIGTIKLFDDSYEIVPEIILTKENYIRSILRAEETFFIFQKFAILELTFNIIYTTNAEYMDNCIPLVFMEERNDIARRWTTSTINYY
jgi:hypothetical protein